MWDQVQGEADPELKYQGQDRASSKTGFFKSHSLPTMHIQMWPLVLSAGLGDTLQSTVVVSKPEGPGISRTVVPQEEL